MLLAEGFDVMNDSVFKTQKEIIHLNGKGLFSKEEVTVSIQKADKASGIIFVLEKDKKNSGYFRSSGMILSGRICMTDLSILIPARNEMFLKQSGKSEQ